MYEYMYEMCALKEHQVPGMGTPNEWRRSVFRSCLDRGWTMQMEFDYNTNTIPPLVRGFCRGVCVSSPHAAVANKNYEYIRARTISPERNK